ncbi:MAG: hypothetical protein ACXWDI_05300 [Nocardioides sp.]
MSHTRRPARLAAIAGAAALLLALPAPAMAHGDRDRMQRMQETYAATANIPLVASDTVTHVRQKPGQAGISGCFMKSQPLFVSSGLDSVKVWNVGDPAAPFELGSLESAQFENEAMNCGERKTTDGIRRFVLIGVDLYQASPNQDDIQHVNIGGGELVVVDVTDPQNPRIRSRVPGTTSTHTVACVDEFDCKYAYSAGDSGSKKFSIFDLRKLGKPKELDSDPDKAGVQPFSTPTAGHKWNFDNAGFGSHTGFAGTSIFDVRKPRHPRLVTTTGLAGKGEDPKFEGFNDFIHHNSLRPHAKKFQKGAPPALDNGNVLLVTEEDYEQTDCTKAGSFQTWKVQTLGGRKGAIVPLDKVELADLGTFPVPQYAFCSAHWFDYHQSGIVAAGFYGGGLQLIDVRNPRDIKSYGHATWGASEVWDAYWVPKYDTAGNIKKKKTNLLYTVDLVRGLDVYHVDLPGGDRIAQPARLGAGNPFVTMSWPEDGVPVTLVLGALLGSVALRRRARSRA